MLGWCVRIHTLLQTLNEDDSGQDLVEYALVAVIIALAATAGMGSVASQINEVFSNVAKKIAGYGT